MSRRVAIYCRGKAVRANLAAQEASRRVASPERREKRSQGVGITDGRYGSAKTLRELGTVPGPAIIGNSRGFGASALAFRHRWPSIEFMTTATETERPAPQIARAARLFEDLRSRTLDPPGVRAVAVARDGGVLHLGFARVV